MDSPILEALLRFVGALAIVAAASALVAWVGIHLWPSGREPAGFFVVAGAIVVAACLGAFAVVRGAPRSAFLVRDAAIAVFVPSSAMLAASLLLAVHCMTGDCI